jgi:O-antigen/teichoic acid export membrane protein
LNIIFGAQYMEGAPILSVLAVSVLFLTMNAITSSALSGMGMPRQNTVAVLIGAGVNFLLNLYLIPKYGGVGAAISTLISSVIIFSINIYNVQNQVRFKAPMLGWFKTVLAGGCFYFTLSLSRALPVDNQYCKIILAVALGLAVYVLVVMLLRIVTKEDIITLRRKIMHK